MNKKVRTRKVSVNGHIVEVVTVSVFAKIVDRSKDTIFRWERSGVIPVAPFTVSKVRCYPLELCYKVAPIIMEWPKNRPPSAEDVVKITRLFNEEIKKYAS